MYKILLPLLLFVHSSLWSQTKKNYIDSKIEQVTIFLQGAQVQRSGNAVIPAGKSEWIFSNISPQIEKQSIQLKAQGKITILSVQHQLNYLKEQEVREETKTLEDARNTIQEKITQDRNLIQVYRQEETMLTKNQDIKGAQANLKAEELKAAVDFQRQRLIEVYSKITETEKQIKKSETALDKIQQQLNELQFRKDQATSEVMVTIVAKEPTNAKFELSYLVREARWYPSYDVRVKSITEPVNLEINANITQQSGEDWKDVKLLLSSGNPDENGTKPTLQPWHLYFVTPPPPVALNEVVIVGYAKEKLAKQEMYEAKSSMKQKATNNVEIEISHQPTTTTYQINEKYNLLSDGKLYTVDIETVELKANFEYYAAPKLDAAAYLTAQITDWQDLNLMNGEANLFFEGTFLGKSLIDIENAGDTLSLSLGKDKNIQIKRTLLKENSQKRMLSNKKMDSRNYEITIRNNKQEAINIIIEDQFPISTAKEIEMESKEAPGATIEESTQKVRWVQTLETKKEQKLQLRYTVSYPKDKKVTLD